MTKNVDCIIGGFYGSEGKGKVAAYLAAEYDIAVRVGGPNAGHTVSIGGTEYKFRQLPVAGFVNPDCVCCIGAGGLVNLDVLKEEIGWVNGITERLVVDPNAGIIEESDIEMEKSAQLFESIGSTAKGVGKSLMRKISRLHYKTAKDIEFLHPYLGSVSTYINSRPKSKIMIEGTQGYALSLDHGQYPFCTSKNVLASSLLSDVGVSPHVCNRIIMVIRTYPIRVYGNSGPMYGETTWDIVSRSAGMKEKIEERTTVTNRVRRVGQFDWRLLGKAAMANMPTDIALMFADYIDNEVNRGAKTYEDLSPAVRNMVERIETIAGAQVTLIGTGPDIAQMIDRRKT